MKLNYKKTFLIGLGFFTVSIVWNIYNISVPLYLRDLGLTGFVIGGIMALDNVFAVIMQPVFGALSDRTSTIYGKRMPYLLVGIPLSAISFFFIPFMRYNLVYLMITIICLNFFMSIYRAPTVALMPDLTPRPLRSKANGIINFMGGIGAALILVTGGLLFGVKEYYPFAAGSIILIITIIIMYSFVKEPREITENKEEKEILVSESNEEKISKTTSLIFLLVAIFFWFLSFNAIETFFSTYGEEVLHISKSTASYMLAVFTGMFLIFAIPAGIIAGRIGRKKTIIIGLIAIIAVLSSLIFIKNVAVMYPLLAIGGISWAMININSYPMVVEMTDNKSIGKYTGYYYFFSMLASIISPMLFGFIKDNLGDGFLFMYSSLALLFAIFFMMLVKHGEAITITGSAFENLEHME